jgi:hypothetical protein
MKKLSHFALGRQTISGLVLVVADGLFFTTTNPNKVASSVLIVGFALVALTIYGLLRLLLAVATFYGLPLKNRGRRIALLIGISTAIGVALQSLGELTLRDVVVLILLTGLIYVYTSYGRDHKRGK